MRRRSRSSWQLSAVSRQLSAVNILLIRLRLIGDVVFTTPAVRALRRRFPDARISYVVEPGSWAVVLGNPNLNDVIVAPLGRGLDRLRWDLAIAWKLRKKRFDLVIDFHGGPRSSWFAWATGAPQRIGYRVVARSWMYTTLVERPRELRRRHSVENQWDLLAPLGIAGPDSRTDPTEMPIDSKAAEQAEERLAEAGWRRGDRLIVVHVSAGNPFRRWPAASFVELIEHLARGDASRRILLTAGPSDDAAARTIAEAVRERLGDAQRHAILDQAEEFSLAELRAVLEHASLFIGGDSGPLHVAGTTAVPIVGLYGPTLPERSKPWRDPVFASESVDVGELPCRPCDQRRCIPGDFRCLVTLAPSAVLASAERLLRSSRARQADTPQT